MSLPCSMYTHVHFIGDLSLCCIYVYNNYYTCIQWRNIYTKDTVTVKSVLTWGTVLILESIVCTGVNGTVGMVLPIEDTSLILVGKVS